MNVRLIEKEAFKIVGLMKRVPIVFNGISPEIAKMYEQLTPERIQFLKSISNVEPKGILSASVNFTEMRMEEKGELDHYIGVATSYEIKEPYAALNVLSGTSNPEYRSEIWIPVRKIK